MGASAGCSMDDHWPASDLAGGAWLLSLLQPPLSRARRTAARGPPWPPAWALLGPTPLAVRRAGGVDGSRPAPPRSAVRQHSAQGRLQALVKPLEKAEREEGGRGPGAAVAPPAARRPAAQTSDPAGRGLPRRGTASRPMARGSAARCWSTLGPDNKQTGGWCGAWHACACAPAAGVRRPPGSSRSKSGVGGRQRGGLDGGGTLVTDSCGREENTG